MFTPILNALNTIIFQSQQVIAPQNPSKSIIENPFASPFITANARNIAFSGKNQPVPGGYFAGYYNNEKNIVGKKLFIAV